MRRWVVPTVLIACSGNLASACYLIIFVWRTPDNFWLILASAVMATSTLVILATGSVLVASPG